MSNTHIPERRPSSCCGCGRSGFTSRSRRFYNEFVSPHRSDQSAKVDQRQPKRDFQSQSSVFSLLYRIAGGGTGLLGEWKYWHTNSSEVSGAQTLTALQSAAPQPPTQALWRKTVKQIRDLRYDAVQAKAGSFLLPRPMTHKHSSPRLSSRQKEPHGVFPRREYQICIFGHKWWNLWTQEEAKERKTGGWGAEEAVSALLGVTQDHLVWSPKSC